MAKQRFLNNFTSTFIAAVKDAPSSGTPDTELDYGVLRISDGAAGSLINPTDGDYYLLTAFKRSGSVESNIEVMRVTGVNNATPGECRITVQRAQEGTSAKAFVAGDYLSLRITKGTAENFSQPADLATKEPVIAAPGSAPTEKYWRGDKTWRDFFTDVRAATLTGLSTATNAVVAATDTVLAAIGKLQAQITGHVGLAAGAHSASAISNTPSGGIAATTVQAAINELDSEKFNNAGGDITGNAYFKAGVQEAVVVANVGAAYTINLDLGTIFDLTLTANCVYKFPAPTAGKQFTLLQRQDGAGSRASTWPSNVRWDDGGTAPTPTATAGRTDVFTFLADGAYWIGFKGPKNYNRS